MRRDDDYQDAAPLRPLHPAEERPHAGAVDEVHPRQVEDDRRRVSGCGLDVLVPLRGGVEVELAGHGDYRSRAFHVTTRPVPCVRGLQTVFRDRSTANLSRTDDELWFHRPLARVGEPHRGQDHPPPIQSHRGDERAPDPRRASVCRLAPLRAGARGRRRRSLRHPALRGRDVHDAARGHGRARLPLPRHRAGPCGDRGGLDRVAAVRGAALGAGDRGERGRAEVGHQPGRGARARLDRLEPAAPAPQGGRAGERGRARVGDREGFAGAGDVVVQPLRLSPRSRVRS